MSSTFLSLQQPWAGFVQLCKWVSSVSQDVCMSCEEAAKEIKGNTMGVEEALGVLRQMSAHGLTDYLLWLLSTNANGLCVFKEQWGRCSLPAMRTVVPELQEENTPDTDTSVGEQCTWLVLPESFSAVDWSGVDEFDLGQSLYRQEGVGVLFSKHEPNPTFTARVHVSVPLDGSKEKMHWVTVRFARDTLRLIGFQCTCSKHTGSLFCEHVVAVTMALRSKKHPRIELHALLDMCDIDRIDLENILARATADLWMDIGSVRDGGNVCKGLTKDLMCLCGPCTHLRLLGHHQTIRDWLACPDSVLGVGVPPSKINPDILSAIFACVHNFLDAWSLAYDDAGPDQPPVDMGDYPGLHSYFVTCKRYVGVRDFGNAILLLQTVSKACLPVCQRQCMTPVTCYLRECWDYMFSMCPHMPNDHLTTLEKLLDELAGLTSTPHLDMQWIRNHRARVVGQFVLRTPKDNLLDLVINEMQCVSPRPHLFELVMGVAVREDMDGLQAMTALLAMSCLRATDWTPTCKQYLHRHQPPTNSSKVTPLMSMASFVVAKEVRSSPDLDSILVHVHTLVPDCLAQVVASRVVWEALEGDWKLAEAAEVAKALDGWPQHAELVTAVSIFKEYPIPERYHQFCTAARALGLGHLVIEIVAQRLNDTQRVDIGTMIMLQSLLVDIHTGLVPRGTHVHALLLLAARAVCPWPCIHTHVQPIKGCSLWALPAPYMEGRIKDIKDLIEKVFPAQYKHIVRTGKMLQQTASSKITPKGIARTCTRLRAIRSIFTDWKMDGFYDTMLGQAMDRSQFFEQTENLWDQLEQVYLETKVSHK